MNISYIINLTRIEPSKWEKCFEQLVKIVNHYPVALMRLKRNEPLGVERLCWTKEVVYNENGTDALQITGDFYTLESGSTYTLYKQANKHIADEKEGADYSRSPFWLNPNDEYFHCKPGYEPFDLLKN